MLQQMYLISISLKRNGTSDSKLKLFVTLKKFLLPSSVTKIKKIDDANIKFIQKGSEDEDNADCRK